MGCRAFCVCFLGLDIGGPGPASPEPTLAPSSQVTKPKPREVVPGPRAPRGSRASRAPGHHSAASKMCPGAREVLGWAVPVRVPAPKFQAPLTSGRARRRRPGARRFLNPGSRPSSRPPAGRRRRRRRRRRVPPPRAQVPPRAPPAECTPPTPPALQRWHRAYPAPRIGSPAGRRGGPSVFSPGKWAS